MLLAELEIWHTRPVTPTRRVALGHLVLPTEPAPGLGGVLLAAVVAAYLPSVDDELVPELARLIDEVTRGDRIIQPRLQHRYQVDRHGLAVSVHQLNGDGDHVTFDLHSTGRPLSQGRGAGDALERLNFDARRALAPVMHRALRWRGPVGPAFVADISGIDRGRLVGAADPRVWALDLLGFPLGTWTWTKREVMAQFRRKLRAAHPDHGGDDAVAGNAIDRLGEARRILLQR